MQKPSLNGLHKRADELLAEAQEQANADAEAEETRRMWDDYFDRLLRDTEALIRLCPKSRRRDLGEHLCAELDALGVDRPPGPGLLSWLEARAWQPENRRVPLPKTPLPEWFVAAYVDEGATPHLECGDCGHNQPGVVRPGSSYAQPLAPECWACGSKTVGLLAWFHAIHRAAEQTGRQPWCLDDPLDWLLAKGYRLGDKLSAWLAGSDGKR